MSGAAQAEREISNITIKRVGNVVTLTVDGRISTKTCATEVEAQAVYTKYETMIKAAKQTA